jgi:uncharacterized membrane protein YphA (DoxX/SURF4 family)
METLNSIGWLSIRASIGYVYLYALYMNTRDAAARQWLIEHTGYMFPNLTGQSRKLVILLAAIGGMLMMFVGGISVLLAIEPRVGAALLLLFTAIGIYQHRREREVAMAVAEKIQGSIADSLKLDLTTLQWSAYSGHFSSGLKNWALCGMCAGVIGWSISPNPPLWVVLSDRIAGLIK